MNHTRPPARPRFPARCARIAAAVTVGALLAAAGLTVSPAPASAAAPPTIANPGFEAALDGWTTSGLADSAKTEVGGSAGASRLTHYLASPGDVTTRQTVTGLTEGWWTVSAAVKSGGPVNSSTLRLENCGTDGRTVLPSTLTDDRWLRLSVSAYASGSTCDIVIETSGAVGAWAGIDDLVLTMGSVDRAIRGADLSGVAKNEDFGATYFSADGSAVDPIEVFADAGANLARLKVWVDPADGYNDLQHVVDSAKRIDASGMGLLVDFHYSDKWTDPGQQELPSAWTGFSPEQLATAVYDHTFEVLSALEAEGIVADAVQVGNEINPGLLWPYGQTFDIDPADGVDGAQFDNLALFLSAGSRAVKDVDVETDVILHLTNINNGIDGLTWWYDEVTARGVDFDLIGLSYYGYWHGSLADLQEAVSTLSARYDRDVLVVENAYPFTLVDDAVFPWENVIDVDTELVQGYPATPDGQAAQFRAVQDVVASAPGGRGLGVVYWEPAWTAVPGAGWDQRDPTSGNAWENQAMFDFEGRALPAMLEFAPDATAGSSLIASPDSTLDVLPGEDTATTTISVTNTGSATFEGRVTATIGDGPFTLLPAFGAEPLVIAPGAAVELGQVSFIPDAASDGQATLLLAFQPVSTGTRVVPFAGELSVDLEGRVAAEPAPTTTPTPGAPTVPAGGGAGLVSGAAPSNAGVGSAPGQRAHGRLGATGTDPALAAGTASVLLLLGAASVAFARARRQAV